MTASDTLSSAQQLMSQGDQLLTHARLLLLDRDEASAETTARKAFRSYRSAMNWGEDTADFEAAHAKLDEAGRWVRTTFGCEIERDDKGTYQRTCPVDLAHVRIGMSIESRDETRFCTVCGQDKRSCRHVNSRVYKGPRIEFHGYCNVCMSRAACEHVLGEEYEIIAGSLVTDIGTLDAVALVSRPAMPDARIEAISMSVAEIREGLPGWRPGMPLSCDRCLSVCRGVRD